MKIERVKEVAEIIGIVAILATLILIALQMRQAQLIAVADFNVSLMSVEADTAALISENSEVWVRGSAGEDLSDVDREIFEQIAAILDSRWFVEHRHMTRLGEFDQAQAILNDWSAFLHERPGLRDVWLSRQIRLNGTRELLSPDREATFGWREAIEANLEILDRAAQ